MRKFAWMFSVALLLGLFASIQAPAKAEDTDLSRNWDLRAGFFLPERDSVRSAEGDVFFTIGAERTFFESDRYSASISIDYYGSGSVYNVPFMINARGTTHGFRYGAGAGVGISHDLTRGIVGFAYNLLLGYELSSGMNPITADIRYLGLATGGDLNGWAFTLGYRF